MPTHFPWGTLLSDEHPQIEPLTADRATDLRLPWLSRFNEDTLLGFLRENPGMSLWVPKTGEYVLSAPWRRRDDIASLVEVTARKGKLALLRATLDLFREQGYRLAITTDDIWRDQSKFYIELGFEHIERVIFFQKDLRARGGLLPSQVLPALGYRLLTLADLDLLVELDHASFPWLWWNSLTEFEGYIQLPEVFVYAAYSEAIPVGYASFTMYDGWAHLDRLAVIESQQGHRFGAAQLQHAIEAMYAKGATSVALSTQEDNVQSRRLYKGFGFTQTPDQMNLYGAWLDGKRNA